MSNEQRTNGAALHRLFGVWAVDGGAVHDAGPRCGRAGRLAGHSQPNTKTQKPPLHGRKWIAITGKPLAATAGARIFERGGNAVDAACAMLAATATMWDVLSWGGETQALIYDPRTSKVIAINGLGVAPTGATPEFFRNKGSGIRRRTARSRRSRRGRPAALMLMLAEFGTLSLADVLAPAIELADGYPIEAETANSIERNKDKLKQWPYSRAMMLPHPGEARAAPVAGEIFRQPDLAATLRKLVEAEAAALKSGKSRKEAIHGGHERFYRGDIAAGVRARRAAKQGGLITREDLANWKPRIEEPVTTSYRGIDVYKLDVWTQGPAHAAGAEHPRELRSARHGLQQRAIHPPALPGDEPGVRRSRFLLRRPGFSAGRAAAGPAVEGVCASSARRRSAWIATIAACGTGRSVSVPGRHESVLELLAGGRGGAPAASRPPRRSGDAQRRARFREGFHARHDVGDGRRRRRLARLDDAERRLDPGGDRRADRHRPEPAHAELRARSRPRTRSTSSSPASVRVSR